MMDEDRRKQIALFKYCLIAPVVSGNISLQMQYFRQAAKKEYDRHLSELECAVCGKAGGSCGCKWDGKEERFVKK